MSTRVESTELVQEASATKAGVINLGGQEAQGRSLTQLAMRRLRNDYLTLIALTIIAILTVVSLAAPLFEQVLDVSYRKTDVNLNYLPLGSEGHVLGTDNLGRDHLARLLYGGRVSLGIAFSAAFLSLAIGMTVGVVAGYNQGGRYGFVDDIIMWFITTLNSIPQLFLLIIIASVILRTKSPILDEIGKLISPSIFVLIFTLAFLGWTGTMRLVRGETLSQRNREYVVAAQAIGADSWRIMFQHILPNVFSVLIVSLAIDIGTLILVEAALSFLGLGVQEPSPSWGNMLVKSQEFFRKGAHLSFFPGVLISITVLCLYVIGDGLRDAFDPQANKK